MMVKPIIPTLILALSLFSCATQQTATTSMPQCGIVDLNSVTSRSYAADASKDKISKEFANQHRALEKLKKKADYIEQALSDNPTLNESERLQLSSELAQLYINIHSSEDELNSKIQKRRDDYRLFLLDYYLQILNAKSKTDGIDIVFSKNGALLINRKKTTDINCGSSFIDYTDFVVRITNR